MSIENLSIQKRSGSQFSMGLDLHFPNESPITLKIKDRSDTLYRHHLSRQSKLYDKDAFESRLNVMQSVSPKLTGTMY